LLDHLLQVDLPGIAELRNQAARAEVIEDPSFRWKIELWVPSDAPPAKRVLNRVPVRAVSKGDDFAGVDVTLRMDGDYLGHIEVGWFETEPTRLPRPDELAPAQQAR
jgi:hypothetical protein